MVDNALSHTQHGGDVSVELDRLDAPPRVQLIVRDDGTGFDPADAKRLFDRFARGHDDLGASASALPSPGRSSPATAAPSRPATSRAAGGLHHPPSGGRALRVVTTGRAAAPWPTGGGRLPRRWRVAGQTVARLIAREHSSRAHVIRPSATSGRSPKTSAARA
ncbi:ATP-binding protein [Dactylosporangium darangshiense]|uniref:ATP-binding protein n=1 Tax=Dactylosporangium darangshiense TaxID=579108 RepID=UPI00363701C4